ncbi:AfsR/SARP family transcriptional regulator [Micromonospora pisi]|nr:BTAD domain-containing putative transcriptional regulator [Micromonospora pisi]
MRFGILGPTRVLLPDGRHLPVGGARLRALLALLLVDAGRVVPVPRLIDGLYGDEPPRGAANALQSQVSRLRQALPGDDGTPPLVEFHQTGYRLAVDPDQVDAHRFTRLAAAGHRALAAGHRQDAAALLHEALDLWQGQPLVDLADTPTGRALAARLEEARLAALEDRIEAELGLPTAAPPVGELRELVATHPLRERLRGQLIRALHTAGRTAEALAAYEDTRRTLADELGTDPSAELAALHLAILRAGELPHPHPTDEPVPARTAHDTTAPAGPPRNRPPGQLTSFVGREEELRRVGKLLGEARLVTLHGPGGAGKTRLAIEASSRQELDVCFVELAPVLPGANVAQAVLSALGVREAGLRTPADHHQDAADRLVAALTDRRLLLVLDNCEHVVTESATLAGRLLGTSPGLRILTTSREPLRLTGEVLCPISGLALPPQRSGPDAAGDYPAVRLFLDRATDVSPDFRLDAGNVDAVLRICRTLDGLPLAIELAAARLRALPVAEIDARLDDRFRLLSRGSRTALPRHQTLRAAVEWSWDLLDPAERLLAQRLTVFTGGATLASAEGVCGLPGHDLVEVLTSLVEKSLVEVGDGRYRMLDTIRAYGAQRLVEAGEEKSLRQAHAEYFLDLARTADPYLRRTEQVEWLRQLDAERDNLHTALRRSIHATDPTTALRLVSALSFYWWLRGLRGEGAALAGELLGRLGPQPPPDLAEEYVLCRLNAALDGSRDAGPRVGPGSAQWLLRDLGRPPRQPFLLFLSAMASGPPEDGTTEIVLAMNEADAGMLGGDGWARALASIGLGVTLLFEGEPTAAEVELTRALHGFRELGDRWGTVLALASMVELADGRGDHSTALASMAEALRLAEELDSTVDLSDLLRIRGDVRVHAGDLTGAYADYGRAAELARQAGAPEMRAAARLGLAEVARLRGDLIQARELCDAALAECPQGWFGAAGTRLDVLVALGRIAEASDDVPAARDWYRAALTSTLGMPSLPPLGHAVEGLVRLELARGNREPAALLLGAVTAALRGATVANSAQLVRLAESTRSTLGPATYDPPFAQGAALTTPQALNLIAGKEGPPVIAFGIGRAPS